MARKREWLNFWVPIGVGIAVAGAALKWPDYGPGLMAIGASIVVASVAHQVFRFVPAVVFGLVAGALVFGGFAAYDAFIPSLRDEKLPGFSFVSVINIQDARKYADKYVFQFSDGEGAKVSFYLSAADVFHFTIYDIRGETVGVEVPSGQDGIPLFKFISLLLEAGTASNHSVMRVSVNGHIIKEERFPFHLELGSRNWESGSIGAPPNGTAGASFMVGELGIPQATLDHAEALKLDKNMRDYYHIE